MDVKKNLPSEKVQKEYELNPLKILETIRNEKEEKVAKKKISKKKMIKGNKYMCIRRKDLKNPIQIMILIHLLILGKIQNKIK